VTDAEKAEAERIRAELTAMKAQAFDKLRTLMHAGFDAEFLKRALEDDDKKFEKWLQGKERLLELLAARGGG
jgi:hypothetical protein